MIPNKHTRLSEMKENDRTITTTEQNGSVPSKKKMRLTQPSFHQSQSIDLNNMAVELYEFGKAYDDYTDILAMELFHLAAEYFEFSTDSSNFGRQFVPRDQCENDAYENYERLREQWKEKIVKLSGEVREKGSSDHCNEFSNVTTLQTFENELFCDVQVDGGPQIFCNALRIRENVGDYSAEVNHHAVVLYNMGLVQHRNGKDEECIAHFRKALSILGITLPSSSLGCLTDKIEISTSNPLVMAILNNVGQLEFFRGEHDDALEIFSHALRLGKGLVGKPVSRSLIQDIQLRDLRRCIATILLNVARIHFQIGEIHKAIQISIEMLDTKREAFGYDHLGFAAALFNCGILYHKGEKLEEALQYFRTFVQVASKKCGNDRRFIVSALNQIILIEYEMGMHNDILGSWHEFLSEQIDEAGFDDLHISQIIDQIALLHLQHDDQEIALEFYRERLRVQRGVLHESNGAIAQTLVQIGRAYKNLDLHQEAIQYYSKAATLMKSSCSD